MNNHLIKARSDIPERPTLFVRDRADALRYEDSLVDFTTAAWRFVEPKVFQSNWHIDAICEHLEAVADWQIQRGLLINIPPRHMKSLGANVFFPAWVWAQHPNPDGDPKNAFQIRTNSCVEPAFLVLIGAQLEAAGRQKRRCRRLRP